MAQTSEFLEHLWSTRYRKKSATYPLGVSSEATWRVYLGTRDTVRTKYTLRVALGSPPRAGYAFLQYLCTSRKLQEFTGLGHFGPKCSKSAQKGGTPCFGQFFRKIPGTHPTLSPKSEKKWATLPPRWDIHWGGSPLFCEIRRLHGSGARDLPRIVFLEGGGAYITPCSGRGLKDSP